MKISNTVIILVIPNLIVLCFFACKQGNHEVNSDVTSLFDWAYCNTYQCISQFEDYEEDNIKCLRLECHNCDFEVLVKKSPYFNHYVDEMHRELLFLKRSLNSINERKLINSKFVNLVIRENITFLEYEHFIGGHGDNTIVERCAVFIYFSERKDMLFTSEFCIRENDAPIDCYSLYKSMLLREIAFVY